MGSRKPTDEDLELAQALHDLSVQLGLMSMDLKTGTGKHWNRKQVIRDVVTTLVQ
jgi:hypothetical protein